MLQMLSISLASHIENAMEEEFQYHFQTQPLLLGGGGGGGGNTSSATAVDEAYINGVCAGLGYRSLLTYGSFDPTNTMETLNLLQLPKTEPLFTLNEGSSGEAPPYSFFSDVTSSSVDHHQLPNLLSLELPPAVVADSPVLNPAAVPYGKQRQKRQQQQRFSDKTRCLQKLLPLDQKMDMATILEEAYKYIKFLQAQIIVLQSMPCDGGGGGVYGIGGGDLGRLNRQQLLQVVVNSPVAQTQLYSQGCCLYSVEQLLLLKKNAERKASLNHQMMFGSPNPS